MAANGRTEKEKAEKQSRQVDKEKIAELKKQKKETQEELDELSGRTAKGKAACVLVFLAVFAAVCGILIGMIKMDAGGFASTVLAPAIGDIPIVRSVLPQNLQRKNQSEIAASEQAQAAADSEAAASEQAAAESEAEASEQAAADSEAEASEQA